MIFKNYKKSIPIVFLIIVLFVCPILLKPQKVEASANPNLAITVPIYEWGSLVTEPKEGIFGSGFGLDWIGYTLAKLALSSMTNSIVNWINSGFEGGPTFVTNPGAYFEDLAQQASGAFIHQLGMEDLLCSPFKVPILAALEFNYSVPSMGKFQCTLDAAAENWQKNWDDFQADYLNGGVERFLSISTNQQNNPYGAYLLALDEAESRRASAAERGKLEVGWGSGFVSLKECEGGKSQEDFCINVCDNSVENYGEGDEDWNLCHEDCMADSMSDSELCSMSGGNLSNTTPGKIIADQLTLNLGSSVRQMELADEIGESLAAIFNALINQLITSGLDSLSNSSGGSGDWYKIPPEGKEKESYLKMVDDAIQNETDYRNTEQKVSDEYTWAINKVNELISCYINQGSMSDVINNQLNPLLNSLQSQKQTFDFAVQYSNSLIGEAHDLKNEIQNSGTYEKLLDLLEEFQNDLQIRMHDASEAAMAKDKYENVIKPELNDIINGSGGIQDLLNQCLYGF